MEREFDTRSRSTRPTSSRTPASPASREDGQAELWVSRPRGTTSVRTHCAQACLDMGSSRKHPGHGGSEIGGGFGGKTVVYLEPVALALSAKRLHLPVKMVMTREEVFRASGPTSGAHVQGQDRRHQAPGEITAAEADPEVPGGRVPGFLGAARRYERLRALRPEERCAGGRLRRGREPAQGGRLPCARRPDLQSIAVESVVDELARKKLGMDPIELRLKQRRTRKAPTPSYGPKFGPIGLVGDPGARPRSTRITRAPARPRTRAAAWPRGSGSTSAARPAPR